MVAVTGDSPFPALSARCMSSVCVAIGSFKLSSSRDEGQSIPFGSETTTVFFKASKMKEKKPFWCQVFGSINFTIWEDE